MKRFFFTSLTLLSLSCFAQVQPDPATTQPSVVQVFQDYVIKVIPNDKGRYGYDILQQGKLIVSQRLNPFNQSPKGLSNREDALKVAKWQIQQLAAGAPPAVIGTQPLSSALAHQLAVTLD